MNDLMTFVIHHRSVGTRDVGEYLVELLVCGGSSWARYLARGCVGELVRWLSGVPFIDFSEAVNPGGK